MNPVYLHVTLKIRQSEVGAFFDCMAEAVPILEAAGWTFIGAWIDRVGRLNTVTDLWQLEDANQYYTALETFTRHPRYPHLKAVMDRAIEEEIVHMMSKVPYGRR